MLKKILVLLVLCSANSAFAGTPSIDWIRAALLQTHVPSQSELDHTNWLCKGYNAVYYFDPMEQPYYLGDNTFDFLQNQNAYKNVNTASRPQDSVRYYEVQSKALVFQQPSIGMRIIRMSNDGSKLFGENIRTDSYGLAHGEYSSVIYPDQKMKVQVYTVCVKANSCGDYSNNWSLFWNCPALNPPAK